MATWFHSSNSSLKSTPLALKLNWNGVRFSITDYPAWWRVLTSMNKIWKVSFDKKYPRQTFSSHNVSKVLGGSIIICSGKFLSHKKSFLLSRMDPELYFYLKQPSFIYQKYWHCQGGAATTTLLHCWLQVSRRQWRGPLESNPNVSIIVNNNLSIVTMKLSWPLLSLMKHPSGK